MDSLLALWRQLSKKYDKLTFGYKILDSKTTSCYCHPYTETTVNISVQEKTRKAAAKIRSLQPNLTWQDYGKHYKEMIKELGYEV